MKNKKGQLSIINLMAWLVLFILGVILTPIITGFTAPLIAETDDTMLKLALSSVIIIFWIMIIGVLVLYATPRNGTAPPMY